MKIIKRIITVFLTVILALRALPAQAALEGQLESHPTFAPKVIVQSCEFSQNPVQAGTEFTVNITLLNTSEENDVRNMTVMIAGQGEFFNLLGETDTIYIDRIPAGNTKVVSYQYTVLPATPQAQYSMDLTMDYADAKGDTYTVNGKVNIPIVQNLRVQFDTPVIPPELEVADVINMQVQAMNLGRGKVYNVRAVLEADGLIPEGTMFIGDLEPGTTVTGSTRVSVSGLTQGDSSYGKTMGKVTFFYEDESGQECQEVKEISTRVVSPFSNEVEKEEDQTGQWWAIMGIIVAMSGMFFVGIVAYRVGKRKREHEMVE